MEAGTQSMDFGFFIFAFPAQRRFHLHKLLGMALS